MVALLEHHRRVGLQDVLVERVTQPAVDAIGAEVVHEVAEHRVREEVLAGAVHRGRQSGALDREAEHHGVEVREMGRRVDDGTDLGELANVLARSLHEDPSVERGEIERLTEVAQRRARRHERAEQRSHRLGSELVDATVEVACDVPGVALGVDAELVPQLAVAHAPEMTGEVTPLRELRAVRAMEASRLHVRRLVQHEQRIPGLRGDAMHDVLDDRGTRCVEAEDGGGHRPMRPLPGRCRKARNGALWRPFQLHCKSATDCSQRCEWHGSGCSGSA